LQKAFWYIGNQFSLEKLRGYGGPSFSTFLG